MEFKPTNLPIENEYPKLVRDNILEIIKNKTGIDPESKVLENDEEFLTYLLNKFVEEATELKHSVEHGNMQEELADVMELVQTLLKLKGWSMEDIEAVQNEKRTKNGGFEKRFLLLNYKK